jgi:membrane protein
MGEQPMEIIEAPDKLRNGQERPCGNRMRIKSLWQMLKDTFKDFGEDRAMRLAAAMAYYAIFSIGPLLFVVITIAGWVMEPETVRGYVQEYVKGFVGEQSANTIESMMAGPKMGGNMVTSVLAIVTLLIGAGGVFGQLQDALNTIWEVRPKPGLGIWGLIRTRFLSMAMVLGLGFLLLISLILTTAATAITSKAGNILPIPDVVVNSLSLIVAFGVVTVFFACVYKILPDVKVRWRSVWIGAIFAALLFTAGKYLLGLYLGRQATSSTYGAAGSVIVILLWVYYASIILFLGAEFTQVYARTRGVAIAPSEYAVPVTETERAQQGMPGPAQVQPVAQQPGYAFVRERARPVRSGGRFRPAYAVWVGIGILASWWFKRHPARKA